MTTKLRLTRIVNSCVLLEFGDEAVLTDPWFADRWYVRFGEPLGMTPDALPKLSAIVASHALVNHWSIASMASYPYKRETGVWVATDGMAREARAAGFRRVERLAWGERRRISDRLTLEVVQAHRSLGAAVNSYVLATPEVRVFFGGEARDLGPLRAWRADHPAVDVLLAPVNGLRLFGQKLVMGPEDVVEAAGILGARTVVPIHDAVETVAGPLLRRHGRAGDVSRVAAARRAGLQVVCLETGRRWSYGVEGDVDFPEACSSSG